MSDQGPQLVPESSQGSEQDNEKCDAAANFPEKNLGLGGVDDSREIHTVVGGEEGERKKYDSYNGKDENGFVLAVGDYC